MDSMSAETREWLSINTLIGFIEKRGEAWHYREGDNNHFTGAIPLKVAHERLFGWTPEEAEVLVRRPGGKVVADPTRKAIVRPDTEDVLGIFRPGYMPHGYQQWLVDEVANVLDTSGGDLQLGTAGLLRKGALAWAQFELPENMEVAGVTFRPFFTAATSLDGSLATTYSRGATVAVCDNTLAATLLEGKQNGQQAKRRHTRRSLDNVQEVRDTLGLVIATGDDIIAEIEHLTSVQVSDAVWQRFVETLTKPEKGDKASLRSKNMANKKAEELHGLWATDERVSPWAGTAYGVVAAVNTWNQHFQSVRNMSRPERNMLNMVQGVHEVEDAATLNLLAEVLAK
jgi:phage/plasmid-like protein (TIGR03299 family)